MAQCHACHWVLYLRHNFRLYECCFFTAYVTTFLVTFSNNRDDCPYFNCQTIVCDTIEHENGNDVCVILEYVSHYVFCDTCGNHPVDFSYKVFKFRSTAVYQHLPMIFVTAFKACIRFDRILTQVCLQCPSKHFLTETSFPKMCFFAIFCKQLLFWDGKMPNSLFYKPCYFCHTVTA